MIVIVGSTGVGKSKLALELAKNISGEIINADSMQVYKYMDIGTAKPDKEEFLIIISDASRLISLSLICSLICSKFFIVPYISCDKHL